MRHIINIIAMLLTAVPWSCEEVDLQQDTQQKDSTHSGNQTKVVDTCYVWNSHVVVSEGHGDNGETELLLLSLYEWSDLPSANHVTDSTMVSLLTNRYVEIDLDDWHIPTTEEAKRLRTSYCEGSVALSNLNKLLLENDAMVVSGNARYLCNEGRKSFSLASGSSISNAGSKATSYRLRLLRQVIIP